MSRPTKAGLDYFPHDVDMSEDEKVKRIEFKFGLVGYAIYNKILEQVYKNPSFDITENDDFVFWSKQWKLKATHLQLMVKWMRDKLIFPQVGFISNGVEKRISKINFDREKKRAKYNKNKETTEFRPSETSTKPLRNEGETQPMFVGKDKVKESKVKESKEKEIRGEVFEPDENQDEDVRNLFIRTIGKNPNIPEMETVRALIKKHSYKTIERSMWEAGKRNIKSIAYFEEQLDGNGHLKPYPKNNNEGRTVEQHL